MSQTPQPARARLIFWFTGPVIALGLVVIGHSLAALPTTPHPLGWTVLGGLALLAASFALKVPGASAHLSISETFFFASVLLFGPAPATITIALDSLVMSGRRRLRLHQLLFNPTSSALSLWAGAQAYYALTATGPLADVVTPMGAATVLALICMAGVHFLLNSGLTVVAVGIEKRLSPVALWQQHFAILSLNYFAAASAAFFLIVLMRYAGLTAIAAVLPLICICYLAMRSWLGRVDDAQEHVSKLNKLYMSTIGAFSTAIEAKDGVTSDHIHRVQAYAIGLARALGLTDPLTLQAIETAALLHDTGKLAVPEHILNKPGKLTFDEFETMKLHVDVGADILSSIEFPYPVVPIVRAHHENWDGTGYPGQLRGEEIPIGARILSVVDCYDALTSDRPYRSAMTEGQALDIIIERRGKMYDPAVVDTFLRVYRDLAPAPAQTPDLQNAVRRIQRTHAAPPAVAAPWSEHVEASSADSSEELLAFVSLARIASRTPTLSDIGALAWGHLRHLIPGATFALYTADTARSALTATYTAGPMAAQLAGYSIKMGERISGWVATNRHAMTNAHASLDLSDRLADELRFALAVPLVADNVLVGVLTFYAPEAFADEQSRGLEMIAPHLAMSIASVLAEAETRPGMPGVSDPARTRPARTDLRVVGRR